MHPVETATTVRVTDGRTLVTDGPFADTKEIFGGFYLTVSLIAYLGIVGLLAAALLAAALLARAAPAPPRR